jgi:putative transcriptional regulator
MGECLVSNSIRKLRFNQGEMTQDELAKKVGVTRQTIIPIESAKYSPSLELAFRVARVFGVTVEDVFSFEDPKFMNPKE